MGMSSGASGGPMGEINVTPLVDVMLVLLIIFMVTAPMMNAGVDIDLPRVDAPSTSTPPGKQFVLSIDKDLNYFIDQGESHVKLTQSEILEKLPTIAKQHEGEAVFLRADGTVPYSEVAFLLAVAKKAGIPRVGLVFEPGVVEETP